MVTAKNPVGDLDIIQASAATYYGPGVTLKDLDGLKEEYELNSNIVKDASGKLVEMPWRMGTRLEHRRGCLRRFDREDHRAPKCSLAVRGRRDSQSSRSSNPFLQDRQTRKDRVAYDIAWVADKDSVVDTVNGFIEVYVDPARKKGGWEGIVSYEDPKKAELIKSIAEQRSVVRGPHALRPEFSQGERQGHHRALDRRRDRDRRLRSGDSDRNQPAQRSSCARELRSKSVSLANIIEAGEKSDADLVAQGIRVDDAEVKRSEKWQSLTSDLLTQHARSDRACVGSASGRTSKASPRLGSRRTTRRSRKAAPISSPFTS